MTTMEHLRWYLGRLTKNDMRRIADIVWRRQLERVT